jgi:WD40 repeat protein
VRRSGEIRIWNVHEGRLLDVVAIPAAGVESIALSTDGRLIAAGCPDGTIHIINARTQKSLMVWKGHRDLVRAVAFSRDGKFLASGGDDKAVRLWSHLP